MSYIAIGTDHYAEGTSGSLNANDMFTFIKGYLVQVRPVDDVSIWLDIPGYTDHFVVPAADVRERTTLAILGRRYKEAQ